MVGTGAECEGVTVVMPHAFVAPFGTTTKAFAIDIKLKAFVATYSHWDGARGGEGDCEVENADLGWGGGAPANPLCGPTSVLMPLRHCSACFLVTKRICNIIRIIAEGNGKWKMEGFLQKNTVVTQQAVLQR